MDTVISTENLSKQFGRVKAVDSVSISVIQGEIYGFLGLNGAGKSTTIRMLLGMINPASGSAFLKGKKVDPGKTDLWKDVGYLVETPYAYPELTVRENLEIARRLRFLKERSSVDRIIEKLNLGQYRDRKVKNLSSGNAQRLGLAKALIHEPAILILDEPTNGLDPAGIVEIRDLLRDLAENRGVTIFLSSHILGEISRLATKIGIIHNGRLVKETDAGELDVSRARRLLVNAANRNAAKALMEKDGLTVGLTEEGVLEIRNERAIKHPDAVASLLVNAGCPPTLLQVEEEDLEAYFLRTINKGHL